MLKAKRRIVLYLLLRSTQTKVLLLSCANTSETVWIDNPRQSKIQLRTTCTGDIPHHPQNSNENMILDISKTMMKNFTEAELTLTNHPPSEMIKDMILPQKIEST